MKPSKKIQQAIIQFISNTQTYTWVDDIAQHTIWGFKSAPYKSLNNARKAVNYVLRELINIGAVSVTQGVDGYVDTIKVEKSYLIY